MTCSRFETAAAGFIAGELSARRTRRLETHLAGCPDCRRLVADLRLIRGALTELRGETEDASEYAAIRAGVWRRLEALPRPLPAGRPQLFRFRPAWAAAVLLLLGTGLVWLLRPTGNPVPAPQPEARATDRAGSGPAKTSSRTESPLSAKAPEPYRASAVTGPAPARRRHPSPGSVLPAAGDAPRAAGIPSPNPIVPATILPATIDPPPGEDQLVIRLVTPDPEVAVYWLATPPGGNP